ncbi:esterase/lipase family protein [Sulfurimonas sp.]|uniref:esterase/lipase family protein n=1 Tax=Sulfurimonas sp. TaxID=2022749 RepID=UPI003D102B82
MKKTYVIFIHGLGANGKDWWGTTKDSIDNDIELKEKADFFFWDYKTKKIYSIKESFFNGIGKYDGYDELDEISQEVASQIDTNKHKYDNFILFGHSMGGLIAASAINQLRDRDDVFRKVKAIALCGTPLGGSDLAHKAKILGPLLSQHTKTLFKDSKLRKKIHAKLLQNATVDYDNDRDKNNKVPLHFIRIPKDTVVESDEERYGDFFDDMVTKNFIVSLQGDHSDSIRDLNASKFNYKNIKTWILDRIDSEQDKSRAIRARQKELQNYLSVNRPLEDFLSKDFFKLLSHESLFQIASDISDVDNSIKVYNNSQMQESIKILRKDIERKIKKLENEKDLSELDKLYLSNNYLSKEKLYKKTFLKSGKYITDINQTIEVLDGSKRCQVVHYHGFYPESIYYSEKKRKELIEELKKSHDADRFKENSFKTRYIFNKELKMFSEEDIIFSLFETEKSAGILITTRLPKYPSGTELETLSSITLPIDLEEKPDTIAFVNSAAKMEIIIQEELYNTIRPCRDIHISGNIDISQNDLEKSMSLYYAQTSFINFYESEELSKFNITITKGQ